MEFAEILLRGDIRDCMSFAERLIDAGVGHEALLLTLFAPTARILGVFWTEDLRTFVDVTIALGRLQRMLRHFGTAMGDLAPAPGPRRALLVPAPGEQHTFGLFMVEMFLERAGWCVVALPQYEPTEVRAALRDAPVDLVGVSCSCDRFVREMRDAVDMMRGDAKAAKVIAGGNVFGTLPELAAEVGVDAVAADAFAAVEIAAQLVPLPIADRRRWLS